MLIRNIHSSLPSWMTMLEQRLADEFEREDDGVRESAMSVIASRGKRLRPVLLLLSCAMFGEVTPRAFDKAALVELIHTASLAHDDVVDEALERRGAPSANARWGNKYAVLLGDFFLARVYDIALRDSDARIYRIMADVADAMGRSALLELSARVEEAGEEQYWRIVEGKTATLFSACARMGAICGGASEADCALMARMGCAFGRAFQAADDLLDLQGAPSDTGKPAGNDFVQRRVTLPLLYALRTASGEARTEIHRLLRRGDCLAGDREALRALIEAAGGFDYGWIKVKEYREEACNCLDTFPGSEARDSLLTLCRESVSLPLLPVGADI